MRLWLQLDKWAGWIETIIAGRRSVLDIAGDGTCLRVGRNGFESRGYCAGECIVVAFSINSFCPIIVMIRLAMACASGQGGMVL